MQLSNSSQKLRQIRVLSGPMHGMTYSIDSRLHIGRAANSDIQLVDSEVSRQHATVVENIYGDHVLVDLDSCNGTLVDGQKIQRLRLQPGTVFDILGTEFVYENATEGVAALGPSSAPPVQTGPTSTRDTKDYGVLPLPPLELPGGGTVPPPRSGDEAPQVHAIDDQGTVYDGDLIDDVLEFRRLLARMLRGQGHDRAERKHFRNLEARLRIPQGVAHGRNLESSYRRFYCSVPARLRFASVGSIPGVMMSFRVDGAQILSFHHGLRKDSIVWLSLDLVKNGRPKTVVFTTRVQWSSEHYAGLVFTGAPVQAERNFSLEDSVTLRNPKPSVSAVQACLGDALRRNRENVA